VLFMCYSDASGNPPMTTQKMACSIFMKQANR
jgi:hypothetical protein